MEKEIKELEEYEIDVTLKFHITRTPNYGIVAVNGTLKLDSDKHCWPKFEFDKGFQINLIDVVEKALNTTSSEISDLAVTEVK